MRGQNHFRFVDTSGFLILRKLVWGQTRMKDILKLLMTGCHKQFSDCETRSGMTILRKTT